MKRVASAPASGGKSLLHTFAVVFVVEHIQNPAYLDRA